MCAAAHVVGQVVDQRKPCRAHRIRGPHRLEVHVVDRAVAVAIDEIDMAAADALDRRDPESIGPTDVSTGFAPSSTARRKAVAASLTRNAMAQAEAACPRELLAEALRFRVDDEIDASPAGAGSRSCCGGAR
jgi:RecB family exonuclease